MNKKLLAAAVASTFAVPGIVSASGDGVTFYGALKPRIQVQDSNLTFKDGASRIGWKSSKDMGNGNTVSGKVELGLDMSDGHINTGNTSRVTTRSEEHTSELQSQAYLVCRLLLEKKKALRTP